MKNRILLILAVFLSLSLACNFGAKPAQKEPTAEPVKVLTNTPVPEKPVLQATAAPALKPTLEPTQPPPSATLPALATRPPAVEGPETLDLSSPDLFTTPLTEYSEHFSDVISGQDQNSQALDLTDERTVRFQSQPSLAWYKTSKSIFDDAPLDSAAVDGQEYAVSADGQCALSSAGDPPVKVFSLLGPLFTGQAQRAEAGVMVNGMIADRYELTADNILPDAQIELVKDGDSTSTNTTTIKVMGAGSLYLAREGSFVIEIELATTKTATAEDFFFAPGSEMTNNLLFELSPTAAGEAPIAPPTACQGDGGGEPAAQNEWPMMDDASVLSQDDSEVIYQTYYTIEEVSQFYKTEMVNIGWTLSDESNLGSIINLTFTKDDQEVTITLLQTGDTVTVTISQ